MTGDVDQSVSYARWYGALAHREWREAMNAPEQQQPEGQPANEPNVTTQPDQPEQPQPQQPQQPDTQDGGSNNPAPSPA